VGRTPRPWWWEDRGGWYATVGAKRHLLAVGRPNKRAAESALRSLLVERDQQRTVPQSGAPLVGELLALYLADLRRRVEEEGLSAYRSADVTRRLTGLAEALGSVRGTELRTADVQAWLSSRSAWGRTSKADAVAEVRALFRWAVRQGRIPTNPVEGLRSPPRVERRLAILDPDRVEEVAESIQSPEFRELWLVLAWTGMRPKEARTLEARHVDFARALVIRTDHKSYARTRKARVIPLPWHAYFVVWRAAQRFAAGPIFRNQDGEPWTKDAVHNQVWRLRRRTGMGPELVAYALRHGFATRLLEATGDLALGAAVLGHSSTAMLSRVYGHLESRHEHLRRAVDGLSGPEPPAASPARPREPAAPATGAGEAENEGPAPVPTPARRAARRGRSGGPPP
jgi:integrase